MSNGKTVKRPHVDVPADILRTLAMSLGVRSVPAKAVRRMAAAARASAMAAELAELTAGIADCDDEIVRVDEALEDVTQALWNSALQIIRGRTAPKAAAVSAGGDVPMIFEDVNGLPIPRNPGVNGAPRSPLPDRYYDLAGAVEHFRCSEDTLRRLFKKVMGYAAHDPGLTDSRPTGKAVAA
jgi:hypothetical protein